MPIPAGHTHNLACRNNRLLMPMDTWTSYGPHAVPGVLSMGHRPEMLDLDASPVVADMIQLLPRRHSLSMGKPDRPVSCHLLSIERSPPITSLVPVSSPDSAFTFGSRLPQKMRRVRVKPDSRQVFHRHESTITMWRCQEDYRKWKFCGTGLIHTARRFRPYGEPPSPHPMADKEMR